MVKIDANKSEILTSFALSRRGRASSNLRLYVTALPHPAVATTRSEIIKECNDKKALKEHRDTSKYDKTASTRKAGRGKGARKFTTTIKAAKKLAETAKQSNHQLVHVFFVFYYCRISIWSGFPCRSLKRFGLRMSIVCERLRWKQHFQVTSLCLLLIFEARGYCDIFLRPLLEIKDSLAGIFYWQKRIRRSVSKRRKEGRRN